MQRSDELPKLVDTVKAFVSHEKEIFANVLKARETMLSAKTITEKAQASRVYLMHLNLYLHYQRTTLI